MPTGILSVILAALLFLTGCGGIGTGPAGDGQFNEETPSNVVYDPQSPDELTIFAIRPDTMNPLMTSYSVNRSMFSLIFEPLVTTKQDFSINPKLAESYTVVENGIGLILSLRRGVKWHNGVEFTSADVDYTLKEILSYGVECPYFSRVQNIESMEATGKYGYTIKLKNPDSGFIHNLDFPIIQNNSAKEREIETPFGTGMYIFGNHDIYINIALKKNESWWGGKINIPEINVSLMPDTESSYNGFKMNNIDVAIADNSTGGKYGTNSAISAMQSNTANYAFISLNQRNVLLADSNFRKILEKILTTSKITTDLLPEYSLLSSSPVNPSAVYATAFAEETENIKDELEAAGYKMDRSGLRIKEIDGHRYALDFNLLICSDNSVRNIVGEYVKSTLLMYGISVNVAEKSYNEYKSAAVSGNYDMVLCETHMGLSGDPSPLLQTGGTLNLGGYSSQETDDILYMIKTAQTATARNDAFARLQEIFMRDMPHIPLYFANRKILYNNTVLSNVVPGDIDYEYSNINLWNFASGKE